MVQDVQVIYNPIVVIVPDRTHRQRQDIGWVQGFRPHIGAEVTVELNRSGK